MKGAEVVLTDVADIGAGLEAGIDEGGELFTNVVKVEVAVEDAG